MALGLLLCVSWICFLLFDCSAGLPNVQGYRYKADLHNYGDIYQDEPVDSEGLDEHSWTAPDNVPLAPAHTSYNKPSVGQWLDPVPSPQDLPDTRSSKLERLVNGRPRDWSRDDPAKELVFPLSPSYPQRAPAMTEPGPVHTLYTSGNTGHSSNAAGRYGNANYASTGSSPSATQQGPFPSNPTNVGARPFYPSRQGSPSSGFYGGEKPNFRPTNYRQPTPVVGTQNVLNTKRVSDSLRPPHSPSSYIVQSRNGYQRASYLQSKSRYSPEVPRQRSV